MARLNYVDEATGKRRDRQRRAESYAHAKELAEQLVNEYDLTAGRSIDAERMTFAELADYCEKHYYKAAEYRDERRIAGVRGLATAKGQIKVLREYFGKKRLRRITYADIRDLRTARLQTKSDRTERNLSIATVNRELSRLRRMLNVAQTEGWIIRNPFNAGPPLITSADERKRERILAPDEEARLLLACSALERREREASARWQAAIEEASDETLLLFERIEGASDEDLERIIWPPSEPKQT